MRLPKKDRILLNDELVFKPIRDLQTPSIDRRNSWSKPSHLPAQPSPLTSSKPSTTISIPANHLPPTPSPITPSKPSTAVPIPSSHLPPTPSPTPTRNLKRSFSSLIEVRLPPPAPDKKEDAASPNQQPRKQEASTPSPTTSPPSTQPNKRKRHHHHHHTTSPPPSSPPPSTPSTPSTHLPNPTPPHSLYPPHNPLTPSFSIRYRRPPPPSTPPISSLELKRAAESILRQVDWDIVAEDVASNRASGVFRRVVRGVLQGGVDAFGRGG